MADFCRECFIKYNGEPRAGERLLLSRGLGLCEGCGGSKPVVVALESARAFRRPARRIYSLLCGVLRALDPAGGERRRFFHF